jgi:2-polyprenyl-3-methyl-5-hydroxy-6-metoxy-1,4-benzoquinol methylase
MRVLVVIASYGIVNDPYLERVLREYRSMTFDIDIVVLSNIKKDLGPNVRVLVGLPNGDPWSLPHAHKAVFSASVDKYDLFIYSEDDHLITQTNIEAFREATGILSDNEIAGFLVAETKANGDLNYCGIHNHFQWDPGSVVDRRGDLYAFFSNEHSASYMVTADQLRRAIASRGFLQPPHYGKYDLLCSAATDIYTQCGFRKLICISRLADFTIYHLPNKYIGKYGIGQDDLNCQIGALSEILAKKRPAMKLFNPESKLKLSTSSKNLYESVRYDILSLIPDQAKTVLSVGCGLGETEARLVRQGRKVVALPADSVIAASTKSRGIDVVLVDFPTVWTHLAGRTFDCILIQDVLHLLGDPVALLTACRRLLVAGGSLILTVPNQNYHRAYLGRIRGLPSYKDLGDFEKTGVQLTTRAKIKQWLRESGLKPIEFQGVLRDRAKRANSLTLGLARRLLESEVIAVSQRN